MQSYTLRGGYSIFSLLVASKKMFHNPCPAPLPCPNEKNKNKKYKTKNKTNKKEPGTTSCFSFRKSLLFSYVLIKKKRAKHIFIIKQIT